ncbi:MAG: quercetin 2,3-dioxygenase [Nitrolancea sp.]
MNEYAVPLGSVDPTMASPTSVDTDSSSKIAFTPSGSGESIWVMGTLFRYLVTGAESNNSYFTLLVDVGQGLGPPPHIHHREEEQFYVLEGELTYWVGDETFEARRGDFIHIPRNAIHWFKAGPGPARLLATFAPAGIEGFFRAIGDPASDVTATSPPVTDTMVARLLAAESAGWREHHETLPLS